jgi:peptidoglycan/LPS O-acetylase OafA/YrhL
MLTRRLAGYYELSEGANRIVPMEGVRGLAVLLVFFVHYHSLLGRYVGATSTSFAISEFLGDVGNVGVDLFFVLSGYLIYGAVIGRHVDYQCFMRRRVVRIYPTFLMVFGIYVVLAFLLPLAHKLPDGAWNIVGYLLANAVLLPGMLPITPLVTVAWSLSYEFFYYLTIPLLVMSLRMRAWTPAWRMAFFVGLLAAQLTLAFAVENALHIRLGMFIPGILIYEVLHRPARWRLGPSSELAAALLFLWSFVAVYLLGASHQQLAFLPRLEPLRAAYKVVVLAVTYYIFLLHALGRSGALARVFSWTPLRWLGNMSYSYYLIHGFTLNIFAMALMRLVPPSEHAPWLFWTALPVGLLATLVVSTVLFLLVERPFSLQPPRSRAAAPAAIATPRPVPLNVP